MFYFINELHPGSDLAGGCGDRRIQPELPRASFIRHLPPVLMPRIGTLARGIDLPAVPVVGGYFCFPMLCVRPTGFPAGAKSKRTVEVSAAKSSISSHRTDKIQPELFGKHGRSSRPQHLAQAGKEDLIKPAWPPR